MEDDAYGVPQTAADAADAMPEIDAIVAFRTLDRPVVHSEGHRVALPQRHDLGPALHARPLLGQDKLAAGEIPPGLREQDGDLQRECEVAPFGTAVAAPVARLMPAEIQAMFFNGKPFTAASPSGVKFKMTFTADGKAKRVPAGKGGARSEGEWKLDDNGYCTTWKASAESCFTVIPNGTNKWSVMKGPVVMATWSK